MPTPNAGETRSDFINRCVPIVLEDGTAQDGQQAVAICHSIFNREQNKVTVNLDKDGNPVEVVANGTQNE